jgi:hypothetical protein
MAAERAAQAPSAGFPTRSSSAHKRVARRRCFRQRPAQAVRCRAGRRAVSPDGGQKTSRTAVAAGDPRCAQAGRAGIPARVRATDILTLGIFTDNQVRPIAAEFSGRLGRTFNPVLPEAPVVAALAVAAAVRSRAAEGFAPASSATSRDFCSWWRRRAVRIHADRLAAARWRAPCGRRRVRRGDSNKRRAEHGTQGLTARTRRADTLRQSVKCLVVHGWNPPQESAVVCRFANTWGIMHRIAKWHAYRVPERGLRICRGKSSSRQAQFDIDSPLSRSRQQGDPAVLRFTAGDGMATEGGRPKSRTPTRWALARCPPSALAAPRVRSCPRPRLV